MNKIFLTHNPVSRELYYGANALQALMKVGEVVLNPLDRNLDVCEIVRYARDCTFIVADRQTTASRELFEGLPELIAYCHGAVDVSNIDIAAATNHGVLVTHVSSGFNVAVSEWIIGVMLSLSRNISYSAAEYWRGGVPKARLGKELMGSCLGIVGYGGIGQYLARVGHALGMHIVVYDPYAKCDEMRFEKVEFGSLLAMADVVVCLASATAETEYMFGGEQFNLMKPDAFFINASRGELVDENSLIRALDDGSIAGCAVDVGRADDQMPSSAVALHPKVIATPHCAGLTPPACDHQAIESVEQLKFVMSGKQPFGALNYSTAYRLTQLRKNHS